jgi:ribosomal-protein-alanine N-acetyltransferase
MSVGRLLRRDRGTGNDPSAVQIRWMIRRDLPDVMAIETASFEHTWTDDDFLRCLRQRNCIGMVAERGNQLVGFMVYELHRTRLHVLNFAVHPLGRRTSVGRHMVGKLIYKLCSHRRHKITLAVREGNTPAQLFFRSQRFAAAKVLRNYYEDSGEDAYQMEFRPTERDWAAFGGPPAHRLAAYG